MKKNMLLGIMKYIYKFAKLQIASVTVHNCLLLSFHYKLRILMAKNSN